MAQYDQMFREEGSEQLEIAEQALLSYESNADISYIEEAFRALHTFKGGAHIFSLTNLGDFAHMIESVLDGIRHGLLTDEPRIADKLLKYLDHLKKLMNDPELKDSQIQLRNGQLLQEIKALSSKISDAIKKSDQSKETALLEAFIEQEDEENISTYYLTIKPLIDIKTGSGHPVFGILDDIQEMGNHKLKASFKTDGSTIDRWDLYVASQATREDLEAQFMFIEDEMELVVHKIANFNLFNELGFEELLKVLDKTPTEQKLSELTDYVGSLKDTMVADSVDSDTPGKDSKSSSIRVSTSKIDVLMNLVSELVTDQAGLKMMVSTDPDPQFEGLVENIERHIRQLRDIAFEMTLVPIDRLMGKFRRLVRDCAISINKEVNFKVTGENTELDKIYIDTLSDPIMHILRNCIDHGIESPEERSKKGKPAIGTISLDAYYSGAYVHIEISDDGRGLNTQSIQNKALELGLINENDKLSTSEIYELIFQPGFSTAKNVTNVSGRGVGMDVVKKNIEDIHGEIHISSEAGKGTKFTIKVPLTLSIIDALLVKADHSHFVLPLQVVHKCYELRYDSLTDDFNNLLVLDDKQIPFIDLRSEFSLEKTPVPKYCNAIVVKCRKMELAIITDEIIGEYQAVLKSVSEYYKHQEFASGATILGDGSVALVLDADKLVEQKTKLA